MKRYNIALLVAKLTDHFSKELARGAIEAARKLDANLTIIPGSYLGAQDTNELYDRHYEYQFNVLFDYAAAARFDYIIAATGSIMYKGTNEDMKKFLAAYENTPMLTLCSSVGDTPKLGFDNASGIHQAVKYLADHGRRFIGLLAGNPENLDCIERTAAFRAAIAENGLEERDSYIRNCDMSYQCLTDVEQLLDDNPELDAILCVSDVIASIVYEVLSERGLEVGKDVAVVGYDDQPISREIYPPLATIRADVYQLGVRSVEKAVSDLIGAPPRDMTVDTRFILRPSCFADMREFKAPELLDGPIDAVQAAISAYIIALSPDKTDESIAKNMSECITLLDELYVKSAADEHTGKKVYEHLRRLTSTELRRLAEMCRIYAVHEVMYIWLIRRCDKNNIAYVRDLYNDIDRKLRRRFARAAAAERDHSQIENMFVRDTII
ncbi:MAG: substrate-binding domain-containing protein, partial [Oscillospiraceae bacterium]|nr:substrate-binding domain-containing protein [Oscillospiraceae bacterium]